jgi:two-component system, sensor histidine kinase LadS
MEYSFERFISGLLQQAFKILLWMSFILPVTLARAQQTIVYADSNSVQNIGPKTYILEDPSGGLTFDEVLKSGTEFTISNQEILNFGNTRSVIWCRFTLLNLASRRCILQIEKPLLQKITFYFPDSSGYYQSRTTGSLYKWDSREIHDNFFLFNLLPAHSLTPTTFYLRIESEESIEIPLKIGSLEKLFPKHNLEEVISGIFLGFLILMMLYHLLIYLRLGEKIYLLYALFLLSIMLLNDMMISGMGFEFLWPNTPEVNFYANALTAIVNINFILFSRNFLNTSQYTPKLDKGFVVFLVFNILIILINLAGDYFYSSIGCQTATLALTIYLIITSILAYRAGKKSAKFYLIAFSTLFIGAVMYILYMNNLIPYSLFGGNAPFIGSSIAILLLSFAMADNLYLLKTEKEQAQAEKLEIIANLNKNLERLVKERTEEIEIQNKEIAAQYEELLSHQEQISEQNNVLEEANRELEVAHQKIEEQNNKLVEYNLGLEEEIKKRTSDLFSKNQELVEQNHQLEQFSFITAHNLRSPIARIQGLCNVMSFSKEEEKTFIMEQILNSSKELDRVISDLGRVLEVKKGNNHNFERVDLKEKLDRVKETLKSEIEAHKVVIEEDFKDAKELSGIPIYVESIFYNLLSNSIKYRDLQRTPVINIHTQFSNGHLKIFFKDNGIGINLEKYKDRVFGIYKRFHDHVDGKGLGLHLVKTEVEAMKGKIQIKSEVNKGTTFEMTFPFRR